MKKLFNRIKWKLSVNMKYSRGARPGSLPVLVLGQNFVNYYCTVTGRGELVGMPTPIDISATQ